MSVDTATTWQENLRDLCNDDAKWRLENPNLLVPHNNSNTSNRPVEPTPLQRKLLATAAAVRATLGCHASNNNNNNNNNHTMPSLDQLSFDSSFARGDHGARGFCNWLIPGRVMVGQYPGQNPLPDGPSAGEVRQHLERIRGSAAGVSVFCSLQRETPSQIDVNAWDYSTTTDGSSGNHNSNTTTDCGQCFLQPEAVRRQLPRPFVQYAPLVRDALEHTNDVEEPLFLHAPIEDLSVPECQEPLRQLLLQLLEQMLPIQDTTTSTKKKNNHNTYRTLYIHCWGGRGRAGLVGACLLTLLYPHLEASVILQWVQQAYETRLGHATLAPEFAQSPQTSAQRAYVECFVHEYQQLLRTVSSPSEPTTTSGSSS